MENKDKIKPLYLPAVLVSPFTASMMIQTNVIWRKRMSALAVSYTTMAKNFEKYRRRVKRKAFWWRMEKFFETIFKKLRRP